VQVHTSTSGHDFDFAKAHFARGAGQGRQRRVTLVERYDNAALRSRYDTKKKAIGGKEVWVLHGTGRAITRQIMSGGFKVGGKEVPQENGASYGRGVYTTTEQGTAVLYSEKRKCRQVILAQGLRGKHGRKISEGDSWLASFGRGPSATCVFRDGAQLLPVFVIHYEDA
jgi:hypothetical protein